MSTVNANAYLDASGGNTATINGIVPAVPIGVNQVFSTPTRVAGTNYQNTTGRPITVLINVYKASTGGSFFVSTDNVTYTAIVGITTLTSLPSITVIIPNLYYYRVEAGSTVNGWRELS